MIERAQNWPVPHASILRQAFATLAVSYALEGDIDSAHRAGREALRLISALVTLDEHHATLFEGVALIAASRGKAPVAAKLLGVLDMTRSMGIGATRGLPARVRLLLIETLSKTLSLQEIERLRKEGSEFTLERALAEAQKGLT